MNIKELKEILFQSRNNELSPVLKQSLQYIDDQNTIRTNGKNNINPQELAKTYKVRQNTIKIYKDNFVGVNATINSLEQTNENLQLVVVETPKATVSFWLSYNKEIKGCIIVLKQK